jgi:hypothetical protein
MDMHASTLEDLDDAAVTLAPGQMEHGEGKAHSTHLLRVLDDVAHFVAITI